MLRAFSDNNDKIKVDLSSWMPLLRTTRDRVALRPKNL